MRYMSVASLKKNRQVTIFSNYDKFWENYLLLLQYSTNDCFAETSMFVMFVMFYLCDNRRFILPKQPGEKLYEFNKDLHLISHDCKQANDCIN